MDTPYGQLAHAVDVCLESGFTIGEIEAMIKRYYNRLLAAELIKLGEGPSFKFKEE